MQRPKRFPLAIAFVTVWIVGSCFYWQAAASEIARSATETPNVDDAAATPSSLDDLLSTCPATDAVPIPGAEGYFAPFGYGNNPIWLVGWGNWDAATPTAHGSAYPGTKGRWAVPNNGIEIPGYGWPMKALWVIDGHFQGVISVHGDTKDGRTPLWIQFGAEAPTELATFDTASMEALQGAAMRQYPSYVIFPATGCYELVAEWDGGSWRAQVPFLAPDPPS
jgi:hypothetical protein